MNIGSVDLAILIVYVLATIAFGIWISRGQKNASDYLLGGRNLPWWALLISIVATETSTATFLSVPGIAYGSGNLHFLQLPLGYLIGRAIATGVLLPLYFQGRLFTAYEVLRQRSGPAVRTIASGLFLVTRTLSDGLRLFLAALVLEIMLGCETWVAVTVVGVATVIYTVLGGIKAVVWTDVIQFVVYMLGAMVALAVLDSRLEDGMLGALSDLTTESYFDLGSGDTLREFFAKPYTLWAGLIGGAVLSIGSHGVDQLIVQRYLSARSLGEAQRALSWSGPVVLVQFALFLVLGLGLAVFYAGREFDTPDAVFADFIVQHLPVGLIGIVLGSVFSAAMSTLSSSLAASASALVNDFVLPITKHAADSPFALRASRIATVIFAALQMAVGMSDIDRKSPIVGQVLGIATITTGVILGLFVLAMARRRSPAASLIGLVAGIATTIIVIFVLPEYDTRISWPWYGVASCGVTALVGTLAARILPSSNP
ncbi:MAG: sodium:solute symporter [bacterium]|nr:sodium:solute symporter [bacterium]